VRFGAWQTVVAAVETLPTGLVRISFDRRPTVVLDAVDDGRRGGPPITTPGAVGIGGDNCECEFRDFTVTDPERPDSWCTRAPC
jgi:hypothetical protein